MLAKMGAADDGMLSDGTVHGRMEDELLLTWLLAMSHGRIIARGSSTDRSGVSKGLPSARAALATQGTVFSLLPRGVFCNCWAFLQRLQQRAMANVGQQASSHSVSVGKNMFLELKVLVLRGQQRLSSVLAR